MDSEVELEHQRDWRLADLLRREGKSRDKSQVELSKVASIANLSKPVLQINSRVKCQVKSEVKSQVSSQVMSPVHSQNTTELYS